MSVMRHIFIINPAAGKSDRSAQLSGIITETAGRLGALYEIHITEYPRHACLIVQQAAQKYAGERLRFYACGGDGTLNEVATTAVKVPGSSFTHFPVGSGNDFIKIFGEENIPRFANLEELMGGRELELDYIESDCGVAINILTSGADARVARDMQKYKRIPGLRGHGAYIAATVENVIKGLHHPYRIEVDGKNMDGRYTLILCANGRCYGGGFYAAPGADPGDGLMDVILVKAVSRLTAAKVIGDYKAGLYKKWPQYIVHLRAKEVNIFTVEDKPMVINLDGETDMSARITARIAKNKMRFAVPAGVELKGLISSLE